MREQARRPAQEFVYLGAAEAKPTSAVLDALRDADVVLLPPSNPVVSIGAILQVAGIGDALRSTSAPVVGVSPIVGGAPVRGMADACLSAIGVETSAAASRSHYGARIAGGLLDGWLVADEDASTPAPAGVVQRSRPLLMTIGRGRSGDRRVPHSTSPSSYVAEPHGQLPRRRTRGAAGDHSRSRPGGLDRALHRLGSLRAAGRRHRGGVEQGSEQGRGARRHRRDARRGGRRRDRARRRASATASRSSRRVMAWCSPLQASTRATSHLVRWCCCRQTRTPRLGALRASLQESTRLHDRCHRHRHCRAAVAPRPDRYRDRRRWRHPAAGSPRRRRTCRAGRWRSTVPAVADEIAAAAELVMGKASGTPVAVVRGLGHLVQESDGPGARAIVRPRDEDLFPLGSLDVVRARRTVRAFADDPVPHERSSPQRSPTPSPRRRRTTRRPGGSSLSPTIVGRATARCDGRPVAGGPARRWSRRSDDRAPHRQGRSRASGSVTCRALPRRRRLRTVYPDDAAVDRRARDVRARDGSGDRELPGVAGGSRSGICLGLVNALLP